MKLKRTKKCASFFWATLQATVMQDY